MKHLYWLAVEQGGNMGFLVKAFLIVLFAPIVLLFVVIGVLAKDMAGMVQGS